MEAVILGDQILRNTKLTSTSSILSDVREFLLIFFGAAWSQQSHDLALQIKELLRYFNEDGNRVIECIYISNDENEEEFLKFYDTYFGVSSQNVNGCAIPFNDPRILKIREQFQVDCVPVVVVLDRNLDVITSDGAGEIQNLHPEVARTVWIQMLKSRLE